MKNKKGFTLLEVLVAAAVLSFSLCGILLTYLNMFVAADFMRDLTSAANSVQAQMEQMRQVAFDNLSAFNGNTFDVDGFTVAAKGRIEVSPAGYSDLRRVRVVVCFTSRGRIIGEDLNLNGVLNAGEDINGNGELDSPVELITFIAR